MGCSHSEPADSHPPKSLPKIDKLIKELQVSGGNQRDEVGEMEIKCAELEAELQDILQEIQYIKTGEALSNRNSLKLNRKYTYHEAPPVEVVLKGIKGNLADLEEENARLRGILQAKSNQLLEQPAEAMSLQLELDEVKCELTRIGAQNQRLLKEKVLLSFCTSLEVNMLLAVAMWRRSMVTAPTRSTLDTTTEIERTTAEKEELIQTSPLSASLSKVDFGSIRSMTRASVILLFESLMDEKYEQDLKDLAAQRPLKSHSDFLLDYMSRRHGLPAVASRKLAQFVLGLIGMYTAGNPYAKVMCGLFKAVKEVNFHANFAAYLTHIRAIFQGLKDRRKRPVDKARSGYSNSQTPPKQAFRKEKFDAIDLAGSAPLVLVCDLICSLFKDFPAKGEVMLQVMKPADLPIEDFIIFKICHKMAQDGCSPDDLFKRLDRDHGGTIDISEFHDGIKQLMSMWLSDADLNLVMTRMAPGTAEISREQFFKHINFDVYYNSLACKEFAVSGVSFLLAFMDLHRQLEEECRAAFVKAASREEVEFVEFQAALMEFDKRLNYAEIVKIYNSLAVERLDFRAFLNMCQSEYIGSFRLLGKIYLRLSQFRGISE